MKFQWRRSHIGRTILRGVAVLVLVVATLVADTLHDPATASSVLAQAGAQPVASAGRAGMTASKLRNSRMPEAICPTVNRQVTRTLRRGATATSASIKSARPAIVAYRSERMRALGDAARWTHTARTGWGPTARSNPTPTRRQRSAIRTTTTSPACGRRRCGPASPIRRRHPGGPVRKNGEHLHQLHDANGRTAVCADDPTDRPGTWTTPLRPGVTYDVYLTISDGTRFASTEFAFTTPTS